MAPELNIDRFDYRRDDLDAALRDLRARLSPEGNVTSEAARQRTIDVFGEPLTPQQVVERICQDVRRDGLSAVLDYTAKIDRADVTAETVRVPAESLAAAHEAADAEFLATVRRVRERVLKFQSAILNQDVRLELEHGGSLQHRYRPLRRVALCVPGGAAAYPSTVLMTAVPAQAAGVEQLAVIVPPTEFGAKNVDILATCHELGIREVYQIGGAQGVAALAYGVEGIEQVDKVVGPGNLFVALAKRQVFGDVDIDSIAGPSEVVVLADASAQAEHVAADLIAQAEHSPGASVLITWNEALFDAVPAELSRQLATIDRGDLATESLNAFGAMLLVADAEAALKITEAIAPEHLHIATSDAAELAARVRNAGATFVGHHAPVAVGDYTAGPSHVLPTGGTARFASGLSSNDFLRSSSVIQYEAGDLAEVGDDVCRLADKEHLVAHRESVRRRLARGDDAGR